jgi:hypothetical protein
LRKIKIAISTASAASRSMRSHETKIVRQPARSNRPGQEAPEAGQPGLDAFDPVLLIIRACCTPEGKCLDLFRV